MSRKIPKAIHPIAGTLALLTILTFWCSTVIVEIFGSEQAIIVVKRTIPWGFIILIPALMITGISGFKLMQKAPGTLVRRKMKRMPIIALNGLLILLPLAFYLAYKANHQQLDSSFYLLQIIELIAGALNIGLISCNFKDGMKLRQKIQQSSL